MDAIIIVKVDAPEVALIVAVVIVWGDAVADALRVAHRVVADVKVLALVATMV